MSRPSERIKLEVISTQKPRAALIGDLGYNAAKRVVPQLWELGPETVVGYDVVEPPRYRMPFTHVCVKDNDDLARRLRRQRPDVVLIETPDDCHRDHILIGLESGAKTIICEKPLATTLDQARQLADRCRRASPQQRVYILDHYLNIEPVHLLGVHGSRWVGQPQRLDVVLLESQGIGPNQVRSHQQGMDNFLHHAVAIVGPLFELTELEVAEAVVANHLDSPVPDTYRGLSLRRRGGGEIVVRACVGKYIEQPTKRILLKGDRGRVTIDRDRNLMAVLADGGWSMVMRTERDSGYRSLAPALTDGIRLPSLLSVERAWQVLRLVKQAQAIAVRLSDYPDGRTAIFGPSQRWSAARKAAA